MLPETMGVTTIAEEPSAADVRQIFQETPETTFVTITRSGSAKLNALSWSVFAEGASIPGTYPGDPEANLANYRGTCQVGCAPAQVNVFPGLRVILTRSVHKAMH